MKTEDEKQKLIEAINCKFPQNNIMELYYNIGRVLPFTAQRFPDGRISDWYRNQYVQVVRVEPKGKYGKYGKAFGFYYRSGVREDSCENDPDNSVRRLILNRKKYRIADVGHGSCLKYKERLKKITISPNCLALMMYSHLASTRVKQLGK